MTKESCIDVVDLGLRRLQKHQKEIAEKVSAAVVRLKDAEALLLRAHIAMEDADWDQSAGFCQESLTTTRDLAAGCERATQECHDILMELCNELGYDDPFAT